ncbi:MAG: TrbI/VirB10 family protein [Gammaproteobacteria bacterium]
MSSAPANAPPSNPAPKEDAERLALRGKPQSVTRLNRRTLAVLAGGLAFTVLLATMWALRKPAPRKNVPSEEQHNVERVARAEGLAGLPRDYGSLPKPPQLGAPIGELGRPILKAERDAGLDEMPERPGFRPNPEEDALRAQRLRQVSEAEAAAKAQVFVQLQGHRTEKGLPGAALTLPVQAASGAIPPIDPMSMSRAPSAPSAQEHKRNFVDAETESRIYASASLQTPRSSAQLMAGTIISAALLTGINSDLPGQIIATVTENTYDTRTGRLLLIPQGARLLGQYDSQVAHGQRRVLLVWTRLLMPDGSSIVLDRLPGVDTEGHAGLEDGVDWHMDRVASGAAVSTLLGGAAELATPNRAGTDGAVIIATREGAQDTVNQIGQEITKRNLDIQPTLTVRPGFPLRVIVNKDLILRPYGA